MDYLEQVKLVKEDLLLRQKQFDDGPYIGIDIQNDPRDKTPVSKELWLDILEYLKRQGFIGMDTVNI